MYLLLTLLFESDLSIYTRSGLTHFDNSKQITGIKIITHIKKYYQVYLRP